MCRIEFTRGQEAKKQRSKEAKKQRRDEAAGFDARGLGHARGMQRHSMDRSFLFD
jgi:hypothetical protein